MTSPKCLSTHLRAIISPDVASLPGGASEGHEPLRELAGLLYGAFGGHVAGFAARAFPWQPTFWRGVCWRARPPWPRGRKQAQGSAAPRSMIHSLFFPQRCVRGFGFVEKSSWRRVSTPPRASSSPWTQDGCRAKGLVGHLSLQHGDIHAPRLLSVATGGLREVTR